MQSNVERKIPVSVIIPVYNGEKYIERCLRSIQDQSMRSLEIIVVNDGSTDHSAKIVEQMSKADPRIILCEHPKNMGLFQARLTGVNASHGEYIAFVDADDAVSFDWFRLLYQKAVEEQNDITIGQFLCDFGKEHKTYFNLDPLRQSMSLVGKEVFDRFIGQEGSCYSWHLVWNKLYTRALWMSVLEDLEQFSKEHPHFIMCEDIAFSGTLWTHAQKVGNVTSGAYYYYNRANENQSTAGSFQRKKTLNNINNVINAFALMEAQMKKQGFYEEYQKNFYAWKLYYARMYFNILKQDETFNKKNDGRIIREAFQIEEQDDVTDYKERYHYCYSSETTVNFDLLMKMENAKKTICSEQKQVVSFDIFDTLILRPFWTPADMFRLMNDEFNKVCGICSDANFFDIRVTAEQNCRARIHADCFGFEDITLDEIYDQIAMDYQFDKEPLEKIKELEQTLELRFCVSRNMGKQLFELAKFAGKKVIVCSDMYLPKDIIKQILKKNGYQYDKLYLSSDLRVAKCTGNMFKYVTKKLGLPANSFVHVGDNWESDVISAHKQGWGSIFLPKTVDVFCNHIPGAYFGESYARIWGHNGQMLDAANGASAYFGTRCALGWLLCPWNVFVFGHRLDRRAC